MLNSEASFVLTQTVTEFLWYACIKYMHANFSPQLTASQKLFWKITIYNKTKMDSG